MQTSNPLINKQFDNFPNILKLHVNRGLISDRYHNNNTTNIHPI